MSLLEIVKDKDLSDILAQEGFKLEFDTANIFNAYYYNAHGQKKDLAESGPLINHVISNHSGDKSAAIDVYAKIYGSTSIPFHFIVECKGTKRENRLVLIEQSRNGYEYFSGKTLSMGTNQPIMSFDKYSLISKKSQNLAQSDTAIFLYTENSESNFVRISYTGDFFKEESGKYTKISKSEDQNNLFKGIKQVINASVVLANKKTCCDNDIIVPLIVTNADILLKNYDNNSAENSFLKTPWVLHQHDVETGAHYIPYVFVVSLNHLKNFIKSIMFFKKDGGISPAFYSEEPNPVKE